MRKFLFGIPVLAAALVVFAAPAGATPPATATGTYTATGPPVVTDVRTAGGNTFVTESLPAVYAGDVTGPYVLAGTIHFRDDGSFTAHGSLVCTDCTIGGRTGDFTAVINIFGSSLVDTWGTLSVVSAGGGLAGLHAGADFQGSAAFGTIAFDYHFEP
jgi:hypothetical protein